MTVKMYKENEVKIVKCDEYTTTVEQGKAIMNLIKNNVIIEKVDLDETKVEW